MRARRLSRTSGDRLGSAKSVGRRSNRAGSTSSPAAPTRTQCRSICGQTPHRQGGVALSRVHITCDKNGIPFDPKKPTARRAFGSAPRPALRAATEASGRTDRGRDGRPLAKGRRGRHADRSRRARQVKTLTSRFPTYLGWPRGVRNLSAQPAAHTQLVLHGKVILIIVSYYHLVYARGVVSLCDGGSDVMSGGSRRHSAEPITIGGRLCCLSRGGISESWPRRLP